MDRTSAGATRRLAVLLAVAAILAAACGDPDPVDAGEAPPSTAEVPDLRATLPIEVSESWYIEVVALGDTGEFVFVDGFSPRDAGPEPDGSQGTDVWLVDGEEARLIARYEEAFLYPKAWLGEDGSVRLLGTPCETFDLENDAMCKDVPVHQLIVTGDTVERRELDMRVSADSGFGVTPLGDGAVLTVLDSVIHEGESWRSQHTVHLLDADGTFTEVGLIDGDGHFCDVDGRLVMFPSDVSVTAATEPVIRELRDGELVTVATVEPLPEATAMVLGCQQDGTVLVGTMEAGVRHRSLAVDGTWSDPLPGAGTRTQRADEHEIRWDRVEGSGRDSDMSSELVLSVFRDGAWVEQGRVRSQEDPFHTSVSGDAVVAVVYQHPRLVLTAIR